MKYDLFMDCQSERLSAHFIYCGEVCRYNNIIDICTLDGRVEATVEATRAYVKTINHVVIAELHAAEMTV